MPKIFEYLGIIIMFYSDEHEPIHVHAVYNDSTVKVSFFLKDGEIYRVTYKVTHGNFPTKKLKQLKDFIQHYKYHIVQTWDNYFIWKKQVEFQKITKKL